MTDSDEVSQIRRGIILLCLFIYASIFSGVSYADQNHPELNALFDELQQTPTNSAARNVETQIWQAWLVSPDENAGLLLSQVTNAMSAGQLQLALRLSNQLVDSNPTFAEAWNKRATIQYLLGHHGKSVADIKQTLLLEPRHFGALSGLGLIFMASGNYEAALDAFNAVLTISPSSDNARGSIARVESLIGEDI